MYIDGELQGTEGTYSLPVGTYELMIRKDGYQEVTRIINIQSSRNVETFNLMEMEKEKIRIVLTDFTLQDQESSLKPYETQISQAIEEAFVDCQEITVVTRKELITILEAEGEEDKFKGGIFDPNELAKRNKKIGANYIITGNFSQNEDSIQIQAKMLNMEKGTIDLIKNVRVERQALLLDAARFLSLQMIAAKFAKVAITNIEYSSSDPRQIEIHGTTSCLPEGWFIWISVQPSGVDRHYPQGYATVTGTNWGVKSVYLGDENKEEYLYRSYHVYAILADLAAHEIFSEYKRQQMYTGFSMLPNGTKIYDDRVITRRLR